MNGGLGAKPPAGELFLKQRHGRERQHPDEAARPAGLFDSATEQVSARPEVRAGRPDRDEAAGRAGRLAAGLLRAGQARAFAGSQSATGSGAASGGVGEKPSTKPSTISSITEY